MISIQEATKLQDDVRADLRVTPRSIDHLANHPPPRQLELALLARALRGPQQERVRVGGRRRPHRVDPVDLARFLLHGGNLTRRARASKGDMAQTAWLETNSALSASGSARAARGDLLHPFAAVASTAAVAAIWSGPCP